jgi:hypothetical protein
MKIFAYCAQSLAESMMKIVGDGALLTCPPTTAETFDPGWLMGYDLLMFDLHGEPQDAQWYGDGRLAALSAATIYQTRLQGSVVFALNCYLADQDSPMLDALLSAGASYVIAGDGPNYAGVKTVFGAGSLALWFRRFFVRGMPATRALWLAKNAVKPELLVGNRAAAKDTLAFRAFVRHDLLT